MLNWNRWLVLGFVIVPTITLAPSLLIAPGLEWARRGVAAVVDQRVQDRHDHAICRECGEIYDIDRRHFPLPAPPPRLPQGLRVKGLRLEYEVLCSSCASR